MTSHRNLKTTGSLVLLALVFVIDGGLLLSRGGSWSEAALAALLTAAPYAVLALVARVASRNAWIAGTLVLLILTTYGIVGTATDPQAALVFIWILPLQMLVAAGIGWRYILE